MEDDREAMKAEAMDGYKDATLAEEFQIQEV